jgi:gliding motility-associated-like protein
MKKVIFLLCMSGFINTVLADGTKNCYANQADTVYQRGFNIFSVNSGLGSVMGCPEFRRIKVRIINPSSEVICIGMRGVEAGFYRLLNPDSTIAISGTSIPTNTSTPGYIDSYFKLFQGPTILNSSGGYASITYTPTMAGDYWIEFNKGNNFVTPSATSLTPLGSGSNASAMRLLMLDITVASSTAIPLPTEIVGRVHCKQWNFSQSSNAPTSQEFQSPVYAYTTDSIINKISFPNSIRGINWTLAMNDFGVTNTLTPAASRKSILLESADTIAKYELFLTPPDMNYYKPRQQFLNQTTINPSSLLIDPICNGVGVWDSLYRFELTANATFQIDFLIDLNGSLGFQAGTTDVLIPVVLNSGTNTIVWDGYDGLGNFVPAGTNLSAVSNFINYGVTHIPLFDIEGYRGIKVETLYPLSIANPAQILYYDDTALPNGVSNYTGCASPCHSISAAVGTDSNTINTWFNSFQNQQTLGTFTLLAPVEITAVSSTSASCTGLCNGSASLSYTGGLAPYSFSWSVPTETNSSIANICSGIYTCSVADFYGCKSTQTFVISQPTLLATVSATNNTICNGGNGMASVNVSGGLAAYNYTWYPSLQNTAVAVNLSANIYTLVVVDAQNCSKTTTVSIDTFTPSIISNISAGILPCVGGTTNLNVLTTSTSSNVTYEWSGAGIISGSNTANPIINNLGFYSVNVTDNVTGCISNQTIVASSVNQNSVVAQFNTNVITGVAPLAVNFNNVSSGATSYTWSFGNGQGVSTQTNPSYNYSTPGTYNVILVAKDGLCNSTARLDIKVIDSFGPIPQIFTPNGDAFNPTFEIKGLDSYPNNDIQIFNRWGNLVYTARSYKNDWDGTANVQGALGNNKLPAGTYYYILDLGDDKNSVYKGFVQMQY